MMKGIVSFGSLDMIESAHCSVYSLYLKWTYSPLDAYLPVSIELLF